MNETSFKWIDELFEREKAQRMLEGIRYPRAKHSHRCRHCGEAVYCYKAQCIKPQRVERCLYCK